MTEALSPFDTRNLWGDKTKAPYNDAEMLFSQHLHQGLDDLISGKRSSLFLARRKIEDPHGLYAMVIPACQNGTKVRAEVIEKLIGQVIAFTGVESQSAGPPSQQEVGGRFVERQLVPTRYPHIVLERMDYFSTDEAIPDESSLQLMRIQNVRAQAEEDARLTKFVLGVELASLFTKFLP